MHDLDRPARVEHPGSERALGGVGREHHRVAVHDRAVALPLGEIGADHVGEIGACPGQRDHIHPERGRIGG